MIGTIKLNETCTPQIGTICLICDGFIRVDDVVQIHPQVCDECRKRLKKILYPERDRAHDN